MSRQQLTAFVDIEASAFHGYPIEIGWVVVDSWTGAETNSGASLIRPELQWSAEMLWDELTEDLHGISRTDIAGAPSAADVMEMFLQATSLPDAEILYVSDSPLFDQAWLDMLFDAAHIPADLWITLRDLGLALSGPHIDLDRCKAAQDAFVHRIAAHRALADAQALADFYRSCLRL